MGIDVFIADYFKNLNYETSFALRNLLLGFLLIFFLGLSSSCTLSNVIIQDLHAMPKPKATTNGHYNGLLQGSWTGPLPTAKPTKMAPPPQQPKINHDMRNLNIGFGHSNRLDRPNFDSNRSMENTKPGDTNVCIICTQRKRGKRMKELYKDCIHDRFEILHLRAN